MYIYFFFLRILFFVLFLCSCFLFFVLFFWGVGFVCVVCCFILFVVFDYARCVMGAGP